MLEKLLTTTVVNQHRHKFWAVYEHPYITCFTCYHAIQWVLSLVTKDIVLKAPAKAQYVIYNGPIISCYVFTTWKYMLWSGISTKMS